MNSSSYQQGFLDTLANKMNLGGFTQKLNISKSALIEIGIYLGIGFVIGFVLKRYSKLFLIIVLAMLVVWFLHHIGILVVIVNWDKVQELILGFQSVSIAMQGDFGSSVWQWIIHHVAATISFIIGFLAGIRLA